MFGLEGNILMSETFSNGYALLIGVGGADIPVTVKDATALQEVLANPARAAYPPNQIALLTETGATRQSILTAFDNLIRQVNSNANATVIIYFSGHGARIEKKNKAIDYFLLPHGYDLSRIAKTAISSSEFIARIDAIKASKLIVLLDCCHAGGITSRKAPEGVTVKSVALPPNLLDILDKGSGRVVIASSQEDEYSYTGTPYSVFTTCLLEALNGKATVDKDGLVRIRDVSKYLKEQVPQRVTPPHQQHPFWNQENMDDNFPLCFYAGGSKAVPGEVLSSPDPTFHNLAPRQRQWLEEESNDLQELRRILMGRINAQRKEWILTGDSARRYALTINIQDDQKTLINFEARLHEIEQLLR